MPVFKDDTKAALILKGTTEVPRHNRRVYIGIAVAVALTLAIAAFVVTRKGAKPESASRSVATTAAPAASAAAVPAPATTAVTAGVVAASSTTSSSAPQFVAPESSKAKIVEHAEIVTLAAAAPAAKLESPTAPTTVNAGKPDGATGTKAPLELLDDAKRAEEQAGEDLAAQERARSLYQEALDSGKLEATAETICVAKLSDLTNRLVLDARHPCKQPAAVFHKVEPGDSVERIAKRYKVNQGQLKRINKLNDKLSIRVGQTLKLLPGEVLYLVDRTKLTGTLTIGGVFIRRYPVGIGPGDSTPRGEYHVENKLINPDWYYDGKKVPFGDSNNILGTRWMGMSPGGSVQAAGLGVHGTKFPESVPGRESKGCVRMINSDVEELYDFMPQGGTVKVIN